MKTLVLLALCTTAFGQTAESLRADVTYLSSDKLEGRRTEEHGLGLAATYIADQFAKAGLQPVYAGTYFQIARFSTDPYRMVLKQGHKTTVVKRGNVLLHALTALNFDAAPIVHVSASGPLPDIEGRIVAAPDQHDIRDLADHKPALILLYGSSVPAAAPFSPPVVHVTNAEAAEADTLTLQTSEPVRNVAGILPGSDPSFRNQFVIVSAHYDHLGRDRKGVIYPGANDDASGTASLIAIAGKLATTPERPKRSILFLAFWGEEEGLLGSAFYVQHPLVPLKDTVADLNLEQLGRTDEVSGVRKASFSMTGSAYSNLGPMIRDAVAAEGVTIYNRTDDAKFFDRSDNFSFAAHDVVDTTFVVAFDYPGYHQPTDTVDKIDFDNLATVDRGIAAAVVQLANSPDRPVWTRKH